MKLLNVLILIFLQFSIQFTQAQNFNENWQTELNKLVVDFKACKGTIENNYNPCSKFSGESLKVVYGLDDFYSKDLNRYMTGTEIASFLETSGLWQKSGMGSDQAVLNAAQETANKKKAVVAVHTDEDGFGHIALILPGKATPSGLWKMNVPNCSSFFMNSPSSSFSEKGLSYAFARTMISNVIIYSRK